MSEKLKTPEESAEACVAAWEATRYTAVSDITPSLVPAVAGAIRAYREQALAALLREAMGDPPVSAKRLADGRREMGERCVRAAEAADATEYNTSVIVDAVRGEVAKG